MDDCEIAAYLCVIAAYFVVLHILENRPIDREPRRNRDYERHLALERLYSENDNNCHKMLRLNRVCFNNLCERLQERGLTASRWVPVKEQVAMFLYILGHDTRVAPAAWTLIRSQETIHRHFHKVLRAVLRLGREFIRQAGQTNSPATGGDPKPWAMRYFKDCVGAIDGTFIPAMVPIEDQPRYRNRKGNLAHNVLMACTFDMKISYVLAGWEGTAHDSRILRAALNHPRERLFVPPGKYYLGDAGFPLAPGFLVPYRATRYHLSEIGEMATQNEKELFNFRHSSLRNVVERTFGLLKQRFAYLRITPFYNVDIQVDLIIACCILHNFIRVADPSDLGGWDEPNNVDEPRDMDNQGHDYSALRPTDEWKLFRTNLTERMWAERHMFRRQRE